MYQFKLICWIGEEKQETSGLVAGNTYQQAMDNLMKYADGEHVIECSLKALSEWENIIIYKDNLFDISKHLTSF